MKNTLIIIILILIGIITVQRSCQPVPEMEHPNPEIIYIYDSTETTVTIEKPVPYNVHDTTFLYDTVWQWYDIDTTAILSDYFKAKIYNDTLVDNDDLFFTLYEVIWKNKISVREFTYINRRPIGVEVICPEMPKLRTQFYLGGFVGGDQELFGAGVGGGVLSKRYNLYTYQYDIVNNSHYISLYWRLKFRK